MPGFVNWPNHIKPGHVQSPVHIVDWMPTLCHVAEVDPIDAQPLDGQNIWPQIVGRTEPAPLRALYWKTAKASAVRQGDWKLILFEKDGRCELFNLAEDPYEEKDLAAKEPGRVSTLKTLLQQIASKDRGRVS